MATYSLQATDVSQTTPVLRKGPVTLHAGVSVYFKIASDPVADKETCALLMAGQSRTVNLPVKCLKIAVLAVNGPGSVNIVEESGGASSSCSR
jgi:hypothetical protein